MTRAPAPPKPSISTGMVQPRTSAGGEDPHHGAGSPNGISHIPDTSTRGTKHGVMRPNMYPELRNDRRYTCQARFFGSGGTFLFRGAVTDISRTGLCLAGIGAMAKGQSIHLKVDLPTGTVEAVAEVRWVRSQEDGTAEAGMRFLRINQSSLEAIDEAMAERPITSTFMRQYVFR